MNEIFDTTPFAYVGENTHYKELTPEEKEELKEMKNRVSKKENPSSEEVQENVVNNMLPQVIPEAEEPDVNDVFADTEADIELLQEALEDELCGGEIYYEKADFIGKIKNIFKKKDIAGVDYGKVEKASKTYTTLRMAGARLRVSVAQNPEIKNTGKHRDLQRKVVLAEKEYRKLKEKLNNDEMKLLNEYINGFEVEFNKTVDKQLADINDAKKAVIKKEYAEENAIIREYAEYLGDDIVEYLTESSNIYYEGTNIKIHNKYRKDLKEFKKCTREIRSYIRKHKYDEARKGMDRAISMIESRKKDMMEKINSIKEDSAWTAICGWIYRDLTIFGRDILLMLFMYPIAHVREWIDSIRDTVNIVSSSIKKGYFSVSDINKYTNFVKNDYDRMIRVIEKMRKKLDILEKDHEKEKEEEVKESANIIIEKGIDDDMKPILDKLHNKGYKTTSSSSGHNNLVKKGDRNDNGVLDEYLYNDARLVFKGKYNFGKAPQYWYWKKVDNADEVSYLDIEQTKYKTQPGGPSNAFQDWKRKYMKSLENWVDGLPNVSDKKEDVKESVEIKSFDEINKEIDMMYESVLGDLMLEFTDL